MLPEAASTGDDVKQAVSVLLNTECTHPSVGHGNRVLEHGRRFVWSFHAKGLERHISVWADVPPECIGEDGHFKNDMHVTLVISDVEYIVHWTSSQKYPCRVVHIAPAPLEGAREWIVGIGCGDKHARWTTPVLQYA